ncbi:hypothetical protein Hdeb2414_s0009g00324601 [Helianthus debilis subsp. tardiflorus]
MGRGPRLVQSNPLIRILYKLPYSHTRFFSKTLDINFVFLLVYSSSIHDSSFNDKVRNLLLLILNPFVHLFYVISFISSFLFSLKTLGRCCEPFLISEISQCPSQPECAFFGYRFCHPHKIGGELCMGLNHQKVSYSWFW